MNAKNICVGIKSASIALLDHISGKHSFSYASKGCFPRYFVSLLHALFRTILSICTKSSFKLFFAMMTFINCLSFIFLSLIITLSTTIFCLVGSTRNMFKSLFAHLTVCSMLYSRRKSCTFFTAVFYSIFSIVLHIKRVCALKAFSFYSLSRSFSYRGFIHAVS